MAAARALVYAVFVYPLTFLCVVCGIVAALFGCRPTLAIVSSWAEIHHWLTKNLLNISARLQGNIPQGPHLIAAKPQSTLETLEMMRLTYLPSIVVKKELAQIPLFG